MTEGHDIAGDITMELTVDSVTGEAAIFLCPVCRGSGRTSDGFYIQEWALGLPETEECRTCHGAGVIWRTKEAD